MPANPSEEANRYSWANPVCPHPQAALYAYYAVTALGLRQMAPPLALMTSQEASLTGALRAAHQVGHHKPWIRTKS